MTSVLTSKPVERHHHNNSPRDSSSQRDTLSLTAAAQIHRSTDQRLTHRKNDHSVRNSDVQWTMSTSNHQNVSTITITADQRRPPCSLNGQACATVVIGKKPRPPPFLKIISRHHHQSKTLYLILSTILCSS